MRRLLLIALVFSLALSACESEKLVEPTLTATEAITATPKPTNPPTPVPLEGRLFFDMNGSGLQDQATFYFDPARLTDERQPLQSNLLKAINEYINLHPEFKDDDLITIEEPGLSGFTVCVGDICSLTDANGGFIITGIEKTTNIQIKDPNKGTPALEMRYINQWKGPIVLPTSEINGVLIPEQHLNDTVITPISQGKIVLPNQENIIGLMQGFLTFPLPVEAINNVHHINGFDHDSRKGYILSYAGDTILCPEAPYCNPIDPVKLRTDIQKFAGIFDSHVGYDFMFPKENDMFFFVAALPGTIDIWSGNFGIVVSIEYSGLGFDVGPLVTNGEIYKYFVSKGEKVYRGQIIGLTGESEYKAEHPEYRNAVPLRANYEMTLLLGPRNPPEPDDYKPNSHEKDPYGVIDSSVPMSFPDIEIYSSWTVFNLPQQYIDITD